MFGALSQLLDARAQGDLLNGANHTGTIFMAQETDVWTLEAVIGDSISLSLGKVDTESDLWPWIRLRRPDGTEVGNQANGWVAQIDVIADQPGTYTAIAGSNSGQGGTPLNGSGDYTLRLVRLAPDLIVPDTQIIDEGVTLNVTLSSVDPATLGKTLAFELISGPVGATLTAISATNATVVWATTETTGPSTNRFVARVTDVVGNTAYRSTNSFMVIVQELNSAPELFLPPPQELDDLTTLNVMLTATDSDHPANTLTYHLVVPPEGVSLNPGTGVIT